MLTDLAMECIVKAIGVNENPPKTGIREVAEGRNLGNINVKMCVKETESVRDQKEESEEKTQKRVMTWK